MEKLIAKHDKIPLRGDLFTIDNLKLVLDDLLCEFLKEKGHSQSFFYENIKIIIGILSSIIAAVVCYISTMYEYAVIERLLYILIGSYFVINGIYYVVNWMEGKRLLFDNFEITTQVSDVPVYLVLIYRKENPAIPVKYSKSLYDLFYDNGVADHKLFISDLENVFEENKMK